MGMVGERVEGSGEVVGEGEDEERGEFRVAVVVVVEGGIGVRGMMAVEEERERGSASAERGDE